MDTSPSDRQTFDPDTLGRLQQLFRSCWRETAEQVSLSSEEESSLRRTIASRIFREAARGVVDEQVLRRRALFGIVPLNPSANQRQSRSG
jgi:hypothetical protein